MQVDFITDFFNPPATALIGNTVTPLWELQTSPTDDLLVLAVIAMVYFGNFGGSNAVTLGLGRPVARGVSKITQAPIAEESFRPGQLPSALLLTSWTTPPTVPAAYLRRESMNPAASGAGGGRWLHVNFPFPGGLRVPPSSSLALWQLANSGGSQTCMDFCVIADG